MAELVAGLIDVFAQAPLNGNALAVAEDADGLSDVQMRRIEQGVKMGPRSVLHTRLTNQFAV